MKRNTRSADAPAAAVEVADLERAAQVRLRPVLGIPPGAYLTVIYGLALLVALFLALLYPGLRAPGGRIEVTATPRNVTVSLDGKFAGTTPLTLDASPGTHELELARAGFAAERLRVEVAPRVFGTLIVRNRTAAHADLELLDGAAAARRRVAEFAAAPHATGIIEDAGRALAQAAAADRYAFLHGVLPFIDRRQALGALVRRLNGLCKPTLCLVRGAAFGGGAGLVACCDVAIAARDAVFSFSEVRLGLIPAVVAPYVVDAIGPRNARRYFVTGERFGAEEARRIGLVHEVAPPEALEEAGAAILAAFAACGPGAVRGAKALVAAVSRRPIDDAMVEDTAMRIADSRASAEGREGVAAFLEKRKARWRADYTGGR